MSVELERAFERVADQGGNMSMKTLVRWFEVAGVMDQKSLSKKFFGHYFSSGKNKGYITFVDLTNMLARVQMSEGHSRHNAVSESVKRIETKLIRASETKKKKTKTWIPAGDDGGWEVPADAGGSVEDADSGESDLFEWAFNHYAKGTNAINVDKVMKWFDEAGILTEDSFTERCLAVSIGLVKVRDKNYMTMSEVEELINIIGVDYAHDYECPVSQANKKIKKSLQHAPIISVTSKSSGSKAAGTSKAPSRRQSKNKPPSIVVGTTQPGPSRSTRQQEAPYPQPPHQMSDSERLAQYAQPRRQGGATSDHKGFAGRHHDGATTSHGIHRAHSRQTDGSKVHGHKTDQTPMHGHMTTVPHPQGHSQLQVHDHGPASLRQNQFSNPYDHGAPSPMHAFSSFAGQVSKQMLVQNQATDGRTNIFHPPHRIKPQWDEHWTGYKDEHEPRESPAFFKTKTAQDEFIGSVLRPPSRRDFLRPRVPVAGEKASSSRKLKLPKPEKVDHPSDVKQNVKSKTKHK